MVEGDWGTVDIIKISNTRRENGATWATRSLWLKKKRRKAIDNLPVRNLEADPIPVWTRNILRKTIIRLEPTFVFLLQTRNIQRDRLKRILTTATIDKLSQCHTIASSRYVRLIGDPNVGNSGRVIPDCELERADQPADDPDSGPSRRASRVNLPPAPFKHQSAFVWFSGQRIGAHLYAIRADYRGDRRSASSPVLLLLSEHRGYSSRLIS